MVAGKHGTIAWSEMSKELVGEKAKLTALQAEQQRLERHVKLLRPPYLCADLLDEQARKVLGLSGPNEIIVLHNPSR